MAGRRRRDRRYYGRAGARTFGADARRRGLYVVVASTLLVLADAMAVDLPPALLARARGNRRARLCAGVAMRWLQDEREPDKQVMLDVLTVGMMFLASPRPGYLGREFARLLIDKGFAIHFGGGRGVIALSIVLRSFLWGSRKLAAIGRAQRRVRTVR